MIEPETYITATLATWAKIREKAAAIAYPQCTYNEDSEIMLRDLVRKMRASAMKILDTIPRAAVTPPSPNTPAPKPL